LNRQPVGTGDKNGVRQALGDVDVLIIGAGASGLMCAIEAAKRGRAVLVLDHAHRPGKKILMSGGGRCNFTNLSVSAENYLSHNPHFCKSALRRFTQRDFLALVEAYRIPYHERLHGQLFCIDSAKAIVDMLLAECERYGVRLCLNSRIDLVAARYGGGFSLTTSQGRVNGDALVVATGGLSIPKIGATPLGYEIARQFGVKVWPQRAGLVPLTLQPGDKVRFADLAGIAVPCSVRCGKFEFTENLLFTHRGLSGPVVLQISSYWQPGESLIINFLPGVALLPRLQTQKANGGGQRLRHALAGLLPKRLLAILFDQALLDRVLAELNAAQLAKIAEIVQAYEIKPNGTEGYRTAEVTLGGVDCDAVSSKTMECLAVSGLYFVGEVLDVTGWLGGYNFQWAWSSGWCAGQFV
jgi:predicted Rossmann fold flavoprotein